MADLSILIPSRNELFLARTVEDLLANIEGDTEILVGMDGQWAEPGVVSHDRVKILKTPEAIGQRALTNQLARLSKAKYIMKVDSHCSFDKGFDVKMMAEMKDHWTMVPIMRNLHAFDWVCEDGHRRYQGPSGPCKDCGKPTERDVVWIAKGSPQSTAYCFDRTLHFQYMGEMKKRPEGQGDITPTMSLQGSFFMMTREKYWELNICDEAHGSWGQQGVEVACKTWLSGGEVMVNHKTWYAHMFRTQGGDFGFPYPISGRDVDKARKYSRDLWFNNKWPLAKHDIQWLVDKFAPVPDWHDREPDRAMIYTTHNQLQLKVAHKVQRQLRSISKDKNIPIVSCSMKPIPKMGKNIVFKGERGYLSMFKQMLTALENTSAEIVYFTEHDVLYHPSHFDLKPPTRDRFYYNQNWWRVREGSDIAVHWDANQVSGLICYRELALGWYRNKIKEIEEKGFDRSYEPDGRGSNILNSEFPNIDIRGEWNQTKSKWSPKDFRDKSTCTNWQESNVNEIPGWDNLSDII